MVAIEEVKEEKQKMIAVSEVLKDLPEWFGIPESTQATLKELGIYKFGLLIRRVNWLAL